MKLTVKLDDAKGYAFVPMEVFLYGKEKHDQILCADRILRRGASRECSGVRIFYPPHRIFEVVLSA